MEDAGYCTRCGTRMVSQGPSQGICPACLFKLGLSGAVPRAAPIPEPPRDTGQGHSAALWSIVVVAIVALIALLAALLMVRRPDPPRRGLRFTIPLPEGADTDAEEGGVQLSLSPDGRSLAFAIAVEGERKLWLRPLDSFESRALADTEGARAPFWSPDGRSIGFFARGKLKRTTPGGGYAQIIADAPGAASGAWGRNGTIVFAEYHSELWQVPSNGGAPKPFTHATGQRWPAVLPDGDRFLYSAVDAQPEKSGVWAAWHGNQKRLIQGATTAAYANGRLFFTRGGVLLAQLFDPHRLEVRGEPQVAPIPPGTAGSDGDPTFSVTDDVLAFRSGGSARTQIVWRDRSGRVEPAGEAGEIGRFALSPDGRSLAVERAGQVWIEDPARNSRVMLAQGDAPVWSPDGMWVAYRDRGSLKKARVGRLGESETILAQANSGIPNCWSPDGKVLFYASQGKVWTVGSDQRDAPRAVTMGSDAALSPDGRWLAYVSAESGRDEVYVQAFPQERGGKWMVSTQGGGRPSWRRDGRAIFFVSAERQLVEAAVDVRDGAFVSGRAREWFRLHGSRYAVGRDGEHFLVAAPEAGPPAAIHVVVNWTADLR
jgi:Tol biopolymer transport system component